MSIFARFGLSHGRFWHDAWETADRAMPPSLRSTVLRMMIRYKYAHFGIFTFSFLLIAAYCFCRRRIFRCFLREVELAPAGHNRFHTPSLFS